MRLTRHRVGVEPEIVARLALTRARLCEAPIRYHGRTYEEGKRTTWENGMVALQHIFSSLLASGRQRPRGSGS
jgi:hypothetical protein